LELDEEKRKEVLNQISTKIDLGFPIHESDCSPQHRKEISKLVQLLEEREDYLRQVEESKEVSRILAYIIAIVFTILMIVFLFLYIRFINPLRPPQSFTGWDLFIMLLFIIGGPFFLTFPFARVLRRKLQNEQERLRRKAGECEMSFQKRIDKLASSVKRYVLASAGARINFDVFLRALENRGVILQAIECPYCGGIVNISEVPKKERIFQCRYCGRSILVIDLFKKFKEVLGLSETND